MIRRLYWIGSLILLLFTASGYAQQKLIGSFFFETDEFALDAGQLQSFRNFIANLNPSEVISVEVFGFCDDRGREGYNDTLSVRRAETIHKVLVAKGVFSERIRLIAGRGKLPLRQKTNIDLQRNNNRRVDVIIEVLDKPKNQPNASLFDTLKVGDKIVLENILFENSRSVLLQESIPILERLTSLVKEKKLYDFEILGHICCNPPGIDVIDLETGLRNLSAARAKLIYDYFIYRGIDKKRLSYEGMKADFPLGKGDKYDRRVELKVTQIHREK
jgi:outer membrane protein OmpA-like peptidoglycan-associated protein